MDKIEIGISSCLCGHPVRHDGAARRNAYLMNSLSSYFEYWAFCPEMGAGLSTPRAAMQLRQSDQEVRLVESKNTDVDHTEELVSWSHHHVHDFSHLSGFILKSASPSCGMERVKIYDHNNVPKKVGAGIFARILMDALPALPVEEEGRLNDPMLRENFLQRVFVYHRWQKLIENGLTVRALMEFHARHKFMLLAHDEVVYRQLGPIIAGIGSDLEQVAQRYILTLMSALKGRASRKRHTNVLMHIYGFIKQHLASDVKQEILGLLDKYRTGLVPLVVPLTMIRHYLKQHPHEYISSQYYIEPYPEELMLRNDL